MNPIADTLAAVKLAQPLQFRNLAVFPLIAPSDRDPGYVLLDDALARKVARVTERFRLTFPPEHPGRTVFRRQRVWPSAMGMQRNQSRPIAAHEHGPTAEAPVVQRDASSTDRIDQRQGSLKQGFPDRQAALSQFHVLCETPSAVAIFSTLPATFPGLAHLPTWCTSPSSNGRGASSRSVRR